MEKTFQKEISFLCTELNNDTTEFEEKSVSKNATFKELSRTDKEQHKLHFKIISLFVDSEKKNNGSIKLNSDEIYDLTCEMIEKLLLIDNNFTVQDKAELLKDSGALFTFGYWLL